jgi:uncharacterized iron-regulated membrane protein
MPFILLELKKKNRLTEQELHNVMNVWIGYSVLLAIITCT